MGIRHASLVALSLLVGCGGESTPPTPTPAPAVAPAPAAPTAPAIAAPTTEPAPAPGAPTATAPAERRELTVEERARVQSAVREGRAASHEGRHADALAAFRRALELDASNRRLRCEAGYVAHLAGDEVEAERLIDAAILGIDEPQFVPDTLRVPYAMCLYNAGLVYQALGDVDDARDVWTDSLALRPNDTVRAHLDALPAIDGADDAAAPVALRASMSDDEIANELLRYYAALHAVDDGDDPDEAIADLDFGTAIRAQVVEVPSPDVHAVILALDPNYAYQNYVVVLRRGEEIAAFPILEVCNPGQLSISGDGEITSTVEDLVPGGLPELSLRVRSETGDDDMAGCVSYGTHSLASVFCRFEPTLACAEVTTETISSESCDSECIREWGDRCGGERPRSGEHETIEREASIAWSNGTATITVATDRSRDAPAGLAGAHDFAALLRIAGIEPL